MNQFKNNGFVSFCLSLLVTLVLFTMPDRAVSAMQSAVPEERHDSHNRPYLDEGGLMYADIDTVNRRLFLFVTDGLYKYDLRSGKWRFLDSLRSLPEKPEELEFGYNHKLKQIQFWSRGVGKVYNVDLDTFGVERVDVSHSHKNQTGHQPFYYNGRLFAFGGYGYWEWTNIMTFFNEEIKEWNIQNVHPSSPIPEGRIPDTGIFVASRDEFYMYGGHRPISPHRADDQYTSKILKNDVWKFSFKGERWNRITTLPDSEFKFIKATTLGEVGRTNAISRSFYSPASGIWYLPMVPKTRSNDIFFLKPIRIPSGNTYKCIRMTFGRANQLLPGNFLFDSKARTAIIVGIDYLSNSSKFPIRVVEIPEDSLLAKAQRTGLLAGNDLPWYLAGFIAVGTALLFIYRMNWGGIKTDPQEFPISIMELEKAGWLNNQEIKLVKILSGADKPLESQELEGMVWSDIDSYDYRRKLRNDTIKSINQKFAAKHPDEKKLVVREKDPNDNRRYFYGLNESILQSG